MLTGGPVGMVGQDQNARAASLGELGVALALQHGVDHELWTLAPPVHDDLVSGAITGFAKWDGPVPRPIFFARSAGVAITLEKSGAFANDNAIVIHADDAWHEMQQANDGDSPRTISSSPGRNGRIETQHVCLARMVSNETTVANLAARFVQELTL